MPIELHIFNKQSAEHADLCNWDSSNEQILDSGELNYSLGKFKSKIETLKPFMDELNFVFKEADRLGPFINDGEIKIEIVKNHHHITSYDSEEQKLIIDADIQSTLMPVYLFSIYYAFARKQENENDVYRNLAVFFTAFHEKHLFALIEHLETNPSLDVGKHLQKYLKANKNYLETQLLRNRTIVGKCPWDIGLFESIRDSYQDNPFSGEANQSYFNAFKDSFDEDFAKDYYEQLAKALKLMGLKLIAQRGSRVAHEQGPILINSSVKKDNKEIEVSSKKLQSTLSSIFDELDNLSEPELKENSDYSSEKIAIDFELDELIYISKLGKIPTARITKTLNNIKDNTKALLNIAKTTLEELKPKLSGNPLEIYELISQQEKAYQESIHHLEQSITNANQEKQIAVVLVQRPSSRSAHFIPRFVLGEKLYIETDELSEEHRLDAIAYNFISPDLDLVASGSNSFFENAAISIVTDKQTGEPDIKWDNAEDLATGLAPALYKAIQASSKRGEKFHYQLETTLFGPLVDLFRALLETELSNIATIDKYDKGSEVTDISKAYQTEILEAAEFVFDYYLLENQVQEQIYKESLSREEAILSLIPTLYDAQQDIANYCCLKRQGKLNLSDLKAIDSNSSTRRADQISQKLSSVDKSESRNFIKKYIRLAESTARKEFLAQNKSIKKVTITSDKQEQDAYKHYDFSVAPSRIDFGKNVVASITSLMGRMLGADDNEALKKAKEYIDLVSETNNHIFTSSSEAGIAKVTENTCRAMQYAKAIAFQGVFQSFDADGQDIRTTINTRDDKRVGIHVMEHGTMASTGYCITKEPLFILLCLSMKSNELLSKLGLENKEDQEEIKNLMRNIINRQDEFLETSEWEVYAYNELVNSEIVKNNLADPNKPWLPNIKSLINLFSHLSEISNQETSYQKEFASFSTELIRQARIINETGILQRAQICNNAIRKASLIKERSSKMSDISIALNASYKGNVSDERENANQYMMALLLKQTKHIKNSNLDSIKNLLSQQLNANNLPKEIRVVDPLVDPDIFMGGELKSIAENTIDQIITISQSFKEPLNQEQIMAAAISYGSELHNWRLINKRLLELDVEEAEKIKLDLETLKPQIKYLETYAKNFEKDPLIGYQGVDVIHLNSNHDEIRTFFEDLVSVQKIMKVKNPNSLMVVIDNPQQGKAPFFDYDKSLEWMSLGGTIGSHMISSHKYEEWRKQIKSEESWAREFFNIVLDDSADHEEPLLEIKNYADLKRELISNKFTQAKNNGASLKTLNRYREWNQALARVSNHNNLLDLTISDWLVLGGRWVLNGLEQKDIDTTVNLFNQNEKLKNLSKKDYDILNLFVSPSKAPEIKGHRRKLVQSGSTKESDLLIKSAHDGLELRAQEAELAKATAIRLTEIRNFSSSFDLDSSSENYQDMLFEAWDKKLLAFDEIAFSNKKSEKQEELQKLFAHLLVILEKTGLHFLEHNIDKASAQDSFSIKQFITQKDGFVPYMEAIFGDHRSGDSLFRRLAQGIVSKFGGSEAKANRNKELSKLSKLGEMFNICFLLFTTLHLNDENDTVNKLSTFFDQYLNVHEEDYPPYMFHRLCAGDSYGFSEGYNENPVIRQKMFEVSCKTGMWIYKYLHFVITTKTVLKHTSLEYRDCLIGDFDRGILPICYQHETISIEERVWDCMRALRNFVRNYHDRHPLPVIIKGQDATVENLFKNKLSLASEHDLVWIAGISNPGKHSWDVNCVLRSPLLREKPIIDQSNRTFVNISVFAPYLTPEGEIKQIYTSFKPEIINTVSYVAPYDGEKKYNLNQEGFVHAIVQLEGQLPKPSVTMSAHTHPQYLSHSIGKHGYPEAWSYLNMKQMYSKTELNKILKQVHIEPLAQLEFYQNQFKTIDEVSKLVKEQVSNKKLDHIDKWLVKASKDSGGRGISSDLSLKDNFDEIVEFIFDRSQTDDVVMQEFLSSNAKALILPEFAQTIKDEFVESGLALKEACPEENIYFATRAFQSTNGIRGYLFSSNIGSVTVNAGQGAKMFYGEPSYIMPLFIAGKIQKLMDEYGELLLKEAIPKHAEQFANANSIEIFDNKAGFQNSYMLNGLFDYIPYIYVARKDSEGEERRYKVICSNNSEGGLDYYYLYEGQKLTIASGSNHQDSLLAIENVMRETISESNNREEKLIDIDLAVIELNSGLGQANLLQRVIEENIPEDTDMFLEWTIDLGMIGRMYQNDNERHHEERQ